MGVVQQLRAVTHGSRALEVPTSSPGDPVCVLQVGSQDLGGGASSHGKLATQGSVAGTGPQLLWMHLKASEPAPKGKSFTSQEAWEAWRRCLAGLLLGNPL